MFAVEGAQAPKILHSQVDRILAGGETQWRRQSENEAARREYPPMRNSA
jgi:hypothetical protein